MSLLFRSLTSRPAPAVDAAHAALRDLLSLSIKSKSNESTHRLPKNLLQMCIRPVLLNLRDYTKLTIPLLRGLSRLLSLLSSWFSKTLGEKLLEHLQRWTDPDKIIMLGIWTRGEEPLVAAAIISLFELLPDDSSHFVELLVKTTLKLENALPRYKTCQIESPFRLPLAKYLNKHEEATAKFFVNDHRLKNPIYSDLLQDIVKRPESGCLRKKLSDTKWSTVILNVCFERPLAIIRAEKGGNTSRSQLTNSSPRNAAEILSMHGINIDLTGQGQKSAALRQVLEHKKEKLQAATKDETKFKDRLEKLRRTETSATPEKAEKIKRSINNAQKQLDKTLIVQAALRKEVELAQKDYNNESAKLNRESDRSDGREPPRSMTFDALELQHQGFCLVETLIENDKSYISQHTDVVRAFRWLWRSKGRHFRLYHEDSMPPRFNGESRVLAHFLVNFAKTSNDVDILFDLLRIFLQPTSSDFSFVQHFLKETVCSRLSIDQKKRVMERFFPVIASEGIEELKVLSIQFLILPMLRNDFERSINKKQNQKGKNDSSVKADSPVDINSSTSDSDGCCRILDKVLTKSFIKEVLLQSGKSRSYGCRLSIELLKLSSLLLQYMKDELKDFHQDLIKFSWNLLKNDDMKTKQWACISICHYISAFPTPSKHILQIYAILLRSYNQDVKDLASLAMDHLLPILSKRLSSNNYTKIVQYTMKILFEEGNSIPTLSHIWDTVVRHEDMFYEHRQRIIPHLLTSLQKLGFPMNASIENRKLCLSMIELLINWQEISKLKPRLNPGALNKIDNLDTDFEAFVGLTSPESSPTKKIKYLPTPIIHQHSHSTSERNDFKTAINILVRLILLIAASEKLEQTNLHERAHALLCRLLDKCNDAEIRSGYFDKVEALCIEETKSILSKKKCSPQASVDAQISNKGQSRINNKSSQEKSQTNGRKVDGSKSLATSLLAHCLGIFSTILQCTPQNSFLHTSEAKITNIITTCMHRSKDKNPLLRRNLKRFFNLLFQSKEAKLHHLQETCKFCLEVTLVDLFGSCKKSQEESPMHDTSLFFLQLLEELNSSTPKLVELFTSALIVAAEKFSKMVVSTPTNKRNSNTSMTPSVSPNIAIFNGACKQRNLNGFVCVVGQKKDKNDNVKALETTLEIDCLMCCIRLLCKSQIPYTFTRKRERLFNIINDTLDSSSNVLLLLSIVIRIGVWLSMGKNNGPLTMKEQKSFISKFSTMHHRNLPEVDSQPLFYAMAQVVLNVVRKHDVSKLHDPKDANSYLLKPLLGCFLVSNKYLRDSAIDYFLEGSWKDASVKKNQQETSEVLPTDSLGILFNCPFDDLGNRLWTFVFVDVLFKSITYSGRIDMQCLGELYRHNKAIKLKEKGAAFKLSNKFESFENVGNYEKFLEATSLEQNGKNEMTLNAIRALATCDVELCQLYLEKLMNESWYRYSNQDRLAVIPKIERLLTSPAHSQFLTIPYSACQSESNIGIGQNHHRDMNSIQMILRAIRCLRPMPMISIDVLMFLAKNYNCWHEVRR